MEFQIVASLHMWVVINGVNDSHNLNWSVLTPGIGGGICDLLEGFQVGRDREDGRSVKVNKTNKYFQLKSAKQIKI